MFCLIYFARVTTFIDSTQVFDSSTHVNLPHGAAKENTFMLQSAPSDIQNILIIWNAQLLSIYHSNLNRTTSLYLNKTKKKKTKKTASTGQDEIRSGSLVQSKLKLVAHSDTALKQIPSFVSHRVTSQITFVLRLR